MLAKSLFGTLFIAIVAAASLIAQQPRPLSPQPPNGRPVVPFFEGFYANPDGSVTLVFGYSNPNRDDVVEIPLGPDNVVTPKQFDGSQPTSFPPALAEGSVAAAGGARRGHERGVFTVTTPPGFKNDVVWTIRHQGQTFSVPGRAKSGAYRLQWPMAMGSTPPLLSFKQSGPTGRGPVGILADPLEASVGTPVSITIYLNDDARRESEPVSIRERASAAKAVMNVTWFKHAGPVRAPIAFTPVKQPIPETTGTATTTATFTQPGDYVVRVKADVFGRVDTSAGNQCCWTNGYVKVKVTN